MAPTADPEVGSHVQISVSVDLDQTFEVDHRAFRARNNNMLGVVSEVSAGTGYGTRYRVGSAWYAKEELTIVGHEPEPEPAPSPRIVCTKCPAIANVHYWERGQHYMTIWASCHGQHLWFYSVPLNSTADLIFNQLNKSNPAGLRTDVESACRSRGDDAKRMLAQIKFLEAAGQPLTPEQFAPMRGDIERNLEFWQTLLVVAERKIGSKC